MQFRTEARFLYYSAHNQGKKNRRKSVRHGANPYLKELGSFLDESMVAGKVELGIMEIPVEQIVGTATANDAEFYTCDFMPLPPLGSEFADQWCTLYMYYLSDAGIRCPITCYEYLGRFYVMDGKKRVSVLKSHGAPTITASVTRILPIKSDDEEVRLYYEFLQYFELTKLYQVYFTQPNSFARLQAALGYQEDHVWTEGDKFSFIFNWYSIDRAFKNAFQGYLNITTADALLVLLEDHSYSTIRKMPSWIITKLFQDSWKKLYAISNPDVSYECLQEEKVS